MATRSGERAQFIIPSLDGIRAAAVMLVFLAHAGLDRYVPGQFGVTAFFFLSGYLITTLLRMEHDASGHISLKAFYLRRALRILPPMYLVLGVTCALTLAGVLQNLLHWDAVLLQIVHLTNYYIVQAGWWEGLPPGTWIFWSLAVEEHFYLVFPLFYVGLRRILPSRRGQALALLGLCLLVLCWRITLVYALHVTKDRTYVSTDTRLDSILFGCILAVYGNPVLDRTRFSDAWWKALWLPVGLVGLLASFMMQDLRLQQTVRYTLQGAALLPLFVVAIRFHEWTVFRVLNLRWVKLVGALSYSLYLVHPTVIVGLQQHTAWRPGVQGIAALALSLLIAGTIYRYVEQPCARLRKRLSRIARAAPRAPGAAVAAAAPRTAPASLAPAWPPGLRPVKGHTPVNVSAVICTRNRPDLIGSAVASVLANTYPSFDLVVIDQSDDGRTRAVVQDLMATHPHLRYVHTPIAGLSRAYNIGVRETTGQVLVFTDDDCIAPTNWIQSIVEAFAAEPDADMLYGQVLLPAALSDSTDEVPTLEIESPRRLSRADGFRIYGMGANFAARRRLFERVGGFDEMLGGGGPLKSSQDFDFQYRAYRAGATVLLSPSVTVDHYGVRNREQWPATLRAYGFGDGAFYFKHVRCGDLFALSLLLRRLARISAREALNRFRRQPSLAVYLRSCFEGMRASLRYPVDRRQRIYVAR